MPATPPDDRPSSGDRWTRPCCCLLAGGQLCGPGAAGPVLAGDDPAATIDRALAAGAMAADDYEQRDEFTVMRDPEGNEFCVLTNAPAAAPWAPPPEAKP